MLVAIQYAGHWPAYWTTTSIEWLYQMFILIQLASWGWAQACSKHIEDSNKHIIEETVLQVGYLPELYKNAQSGKYNILSSAGCTGYYHNPVTSVSLLLGLTKDYSKILW